MKQRFCRIKWMALALVLSTTLALSGCGGGGSDNPEPSQQSVTLGTSLALTPAAQTASTDSVNSLAVQAQSVTAAVVTLVLPDGTKYTMSNGGSGEYTCTVTNFPTGSPFMIEAHAGDLILKNFFDTLPSTNDVVDLGVTDPDTTLFTDLVAAFVGALDAQRNTPTAENLLTSVQGASLQIDFLSLRNQVEDDNDPTFEQVRSSYRAVLSEDNVNAGQSSTELIAAEGTFETVVTAIESGGVMPPVAGNDSEAAKLFLAEVYKAHLSGDLSALSAALGNNGFLWSGLDHDAWLLNNQTSNEFGFTQDITFSNVTALSTAEAGPEPNSWWVWLGLEGRYTHDGVARYFKSQDKKDFGEISPLLVKKDASGKFAIYGDQYRSWVGAGLDIVYEMNSKSCYNYVGQPYYCEVTENRPSTRISFEVEAEETTNFPIESVVLTGSAFAESFPIAIRPGDNNWRQLYINYKYNDNYSSSISLYVPENDTWTSSPITWRSPLSGSSLDLTVTYTDGKNEIRHFTVPQVEVPISANIQAPVFNGDGTVTIQWTDISNSLPGGAGFADLEVEVIDNTSDWVEVMDLWDIAPSTTTLTIPANTLENGKIYQIQVDYKDLYGREFQTARYFQMP